MRHFITCMLLLLPFTLLFSQEKPSTISISGRVLDASTKEPVEQAGIRILNVKDSSYVNGTATNENGRFKIQVKPGQYIVNVSFLGYSNAYVNINANKESNMLNDITLKDDGILLSEAVVTAKIAEIVVKGDTTEYNASSYKVQESAVVEDLLKKMPGVEVDTDGKITVNGKEIKKILVDGKEFFSDDPKVASKNLPAAMIDKLQVLDRKSDMARMTGFDDGEEEAVINLTVKKGMKQGLFGNTAGGLGTDNRYDANAMINYMQDDNQFTGIAGANNTNNAGFTDFSTSSFSGMRPPRGLSFGGNNGITKAANGGLNFAVTTSPKFKWGGDIRFGSTNNDVIKDSKTEFFQTATTPVQLETKKTYGNNIGNNFNTTLRFEWTPDTATQVVFKPNFRYNENSSWENSDVQATLTDVSDTIYSGISRYNSEGSGLNLSGELEVSRKLNNNGRVVSFSVSGGINNQDNEGYNKSQTLFNRAPEKDILIDQIFDQKNKGYNWRGFVSYVEPLGRNNFLQLTYSYRKNYTESDRQTFANDGYDNYNIVDTAATRLLENDFINQEISVNFKSVRSKYNYTLGFAAQPSETKSWETSPDTTFITYNNIVNFAPVAQFNYRWDKQTNLRIDYNGTVNQASTTQLSPAIDESNPLNITYGNPNLKPSFENRLRARYRKFNPEQASALMISANFSYITNDIVSSSIRDTSGRQESTFKNASGNWNGNTRVIYNRPLKNKKFSVNSMTYASYARSNNYLNESKNTSNSITFQESLGLEYRSDLFDMGIRGNLRFNDINYSLAKELNRTTYNYGGNFNTTVYLPYNFTIDSDVNFATNSGFTTEFELNEWIWNASIAKQIFKAKNGTIRLKVYDILQDRNNINQQNLDTGIQETMTNTIDRYMMLSFVYRFQSFKGGAKQSDMEERGGGRGFQGGGRPPRGM